VDTLAWQGSLLGAEAPGYDPSFGGVRRRQLAHGAWVDHAPGWLSGADEVLATALEVLGWGQRTERMYGEALLQPRLTASMPVERIPGELAVLREAGEVLSARYAVRFTSLGANLYRHGRDSVAWHGDRVARERPTATIAIVSVGEPRPFRLRPRDGGASVGYALGHGDLLVMGGTCQRTWKHAVPKVAAAGPRISLTFRHPYPPVGGEVSRPPGR
jgi:alkylated DNA repair dioxygenase AlkB